MAHSEHRDDELLSVSTTPTGSPTLIDGPGSPTRSIHAEISSVSQVQHSDQGLRNIDLFDSADDSERRESVISNYPEGSTIAIKSPQESIFGSTTTNTVVDSPLRGSSIGALAPRSPRRPSVDSENTVATRRSETQSPAVDGGKVGKFATYPDGSTKGIGSPKSPADTVTSTNTTHTSDTLATASTGTRAERSLHVPFLPKFLRTTDNPHSATENPVVADPKDPHKSKRSQPGYWRQVVEELQRERKEASRQQELKEALAEGPPEKSQSFFDANSSDDEVNGEEAAVISAARMASVTRPQLVEHRSSRLIGKDGLADGEDNPGPSRGKAARLLGTNIQTLRALEHTRDDPANKVDVYGCRGLTSAPLPVLEENEPVGLAIQNLPRLNFQDGLRSHPVQRSQTVPARAKRKVSFPLAPLEEIRPEHRALRQSVVSTPYPVGGEGGHGMDVVVFLQLSGMRGTSRRIGSVVVPGRRKEKGGDEGGDHSKRTKLGFDDQRLFQLLGAEYYRRTGLFRILTSARSLRAVHLRPDSSPAGMDGHCKPRPGDDDSSPASARITRLFRSPRTGKGTYHCVDFVANSSTHDTVTVELVEDWSGARVALAVGAALVASLAAVLLWVFLGTGGRAQEGRGAVWGDVGFRGAGVRVEAGGALGVLVLLIGGAGVGGWGWVGWGG